MKILVIDDDPGIFDLIQTTCELGWPEANVLKAETGEKGISLVETEAPNLIILDLGLPDINGTEVLKTIRLFSDIPVMILTVITEERDIVKAFTCGANEFLTKPFRQMEFLARIKAMIRNTQITNRDLAVNCGAWHFGRSLTELYYGHIIFELTPVEGLIVHALLKRAGEYLDSDALISKVWGEHHSTNADTLRVHIHHIRTKLGDEHEHPCILITKPGKGYMFSGNKPKSQDNINNNSTLIGNTRTINN
jgi:DNA-binding response OmpR family regulator